MNNKKYKKRTQKSIMLKSKHNSFDSLILNNNVYKWGGAPEAFSDSPYSFNESPVEESIQEKLAYTQFKVGNLLNKVSGVAGKAMPVLGGAVGVAKAFQENNTIDETAVNQAKSHVDINSKKDYSTLNSMDDFANAWENMEEYKQDYNMKDFRGISTGKQILNVGKGLLSGAKAGTKIGGPLGTLVGGAVGLGAAVGGIFSGNAKAKRAAEEVNLLGAQGEERQESNILANMDSFKEQQNLNYALNYSKFGGPLHTKGGIFDTGLSFIDEGYTHEDNMYGGVPMGVDPEGNPNLVEEGEVVLNSNGQKYVFSNSVYATEDILAQFGLPKKYANASYAYIADKATKEEMETPNDPISKRSLDDKMMRIIQAQEMTKLKQNKNKKKLSNIFKTGGITAPSFDFKLPSKTLAERLYGNKEQFKLEIPDVSELSLIPKEETPIYKASAEDVIPALKRDIYTAPNTKVSKDTSEGGESLARYASLINTGLGLFENRKPDMTGADMIARERAKEIPIGYSPLTQYMTPKPFDRSFYLNKMYGNAAGSRASIRNSAGNRAQALGTLVASDYNTLGAVGDLNRQAEEYNYNNYKDVLDFNRATDIQNLNTAVQANSQRLQQRSLNADLAVKEAALRDAAIAAVGQARSNNRNAFAEDLSNIGRENVIFNMINKNPELLYEIAKSGGISLKAKCGGKLLTKKRRK